MNAKTRYFSILAVGSMLTACVSNATPNVSAQQAKSTPISDGMVVTANPLATRAGADILKQGGSAVDAAIAISAVLSLVEPQSSGLGGGAFMVHFDNQSNEVSVYDGRETAPANINPKQFLGEDGQYIGYINAKNSGLSTGVPGMVSMLELAHEDHGLLPWGNHFDAARSLALEGFEVSPRLHGIIKRFGKYIPNTADQGPTDAYHYFFDASGQPLKVGAVRDNPDYAKTLDAIAKDPKSFYSGQIAREIVEQVSAPPRAGSLSLADMSAYRAQKRTAVCAPYKAGKLCGPPPPSSWLAVGQIMGLIDAAKPFDSAGAESPQNWVAFAQAQRLAYADRDQHVGDSEFVDVPVSGLLNPEYWSQRAKDAGRDNAGDELSAGNPWAYDQTSLPEKKVAYGADSTVDVAGTSHFVVVDAAGDVVSLTASVESIFGSTRMAGGMFLNNQLTDFARTAYDENGKPLANRIEPQKRPRSSMSPTIVIDEKGEFLMATGSPGGNSIIAYTAKTLVGVFEWGLSPQQAVELPNLVARGKRVRIEKDRAGDKLIAGLKEYGFNVRESAGENSGLSVVLKRSDGSLQGGVDSRREGTIELIEF